MKERIHNVLSYKKPALWIMVVVFTVSAVAAVCLLTNPVNGKDWLKVSEFVSWKEGNGEYFITEFAVCLGEKVKSGRLYVEQWQDGVCERSFPAVMTQDLTYIYLHITTASGGGRVRISTNEFGGEWETLYDLSDDEDVTGWTFSSGEIEEEKKVEAGGESILGSLNYNNGEQILIRAVWSDEAAKEQVPSETNPFRMKIFQLEETIELEDRARKDAYISALEQLIYQRITPEGEEWVCGTQEFAVFDIDRDGEKELIIRQDQYAMASLQVTVFDYDEATKGLRTEYEGFPSHYFYENGVIVTLASHNHGPAAASKDFWPYFVDKYNKEKDCYETVAYVEGWQREPDRETYEGLTFPQEADLDGDGMVYYIMPGGKYALESPVDNEEYNTWRTSAVGESTEITFSYRILPEVRPHAAG